MRIPAPEGLTLVALSGGADSVALLLLLQEAGARVEALHCNFQLRGGESDRDERFVADLCLRRGVPLSVRRFDTRAEARRRGVSLEMAARDLRYTWFEQERAARGARWIAVAHHRDDQAETVLLHLLRGTGLRGLCGMRRENGHLLRPLLDFSRQDLLDYLLARGEGHVEDSTNAERDALRNRIRLDVMPLLRDINPRAVEHIAQTAARVASALEPVPEGGHTLHSLHEWLHPCGFTPAQQADILRDMDKPSGAIYESPTHRLLRNRGQLILERRGEPSSCRWEGRVVETDDALAFLRTQSLDARHAYLDADKLTFPLQERTPRRGDRFQPFGMRGTRLVSDFLTDLKLSRFEKERQPLLLSGDTIAWVVGRRTDDRFRVTEATRRVYCISCTMS